MRNWQPTRYSELRRKMKIFWVANSDWSFYGLDGQLFEMCLSNFVIKDLRFGNPRLGSGGSTIYGKGISHLIRYVKWWLPRIRYLWIIEPMFRFSMPMSCVKWLLNKKRGKRNVFVMFFEIERKWLLWMLGYIWAHYR